MRSGGNSVVLVVTLSSGRNQVVLEHLSPCPSRRKTVVGKVWGQEGGGGELEKPFYFLRLC